MLDIESWMIILKLAVALMAFNNARRPDRELVLKNRKPIRKNRVTVEITWTSDRTEE